MCIPTASGIFFAIKYVPARIFKHINAMKSSKKAEDNEKRPERKAPKMPVGAARAGVCAGSSVVSFILAEMEG